MAAVRFVRRPGNASRPRALALVVGAALGGWLAATAIAPPSAPLVGLLLLTGTSFIVGWSNVATP